MPDPVSLTTFVDFVCKSGTPKATVVRSWKRKGKYSVVTDYWRELRDALTEFHRFGSPIAAVVAKATERKRNNYEAIAAAHRKWVGRKKLIWIQPQSAVWTSGNLDVTVNPELGLEINSVPHLIKLYFKAEPLAKNRIDIITHLMSVSLAKSAPQYCVMGVLDLRNAKLITPTVPISGLTAQLQAEAAYWNTLWQHV